MSVSYNVRRGIFDPDLSHPLGPGSAVAVIGAGPAGCSAALALRRLAPEVSVLLFEYKRYSEHFNQCLGVLSPPFKEVLAEATGLVMPRELVRDRVTTYVLHGSNESIALRDEKSAEVSDVVRRIEFDNWLFDEVRKTGVETHAERVTYLEFHRRDVVIYTDGGTYAVDAIIGAFGLDSTIRSAMRRNTSYRPPDHVDTIVTVFPEAKNSGLGDSNEIHTFLPGIKSVEFCAVVPKGSHVSLVVAGKRVGVRTLMDVVNRLKANSILPADFTVETAFHGGFPIRPARPVCGDRWVVVGDASGLLRPFKGKGINMAIRSGGIAAQCLVTNGVGKQAFRPLIEAFSEIIRDRPWGLLARWAVRSVGRTIGWDPFIVAARGDAKLRGALFDAVSGRSTFRSILLRMLASPGLWTNTLSAVFFRRRSRRN